MTGSAAANPQSDETNTTINDERLETLTDCETGGGEDSGFMTGGLLTVVPRQQQTVRSVVTRQPVKSDNFNTIS